MWSSPNAGEEATLAGSVSAVASGVTAGGLDEDEADAAFGSEVSHEELLAKLKHQMEVLYVDPDPQQKAAANAWLLAFQRSRVAWRLSPLLLDPQREPQLQLLGAQSLAWKVEQQGRSLSPEHKAELFKALLSVVVEMERSRTSAPQNSPTMQFAVGGRLAHCVASLCFQRLAEGTVTENNSGSGVSLHPIEEILAFGRWGILPSDEDAACSRGSLASSPALNLCCWVALTCLSTLPQLLAATDTPARGGRRFSGCLKTKALQEAKASVLYFGADVLRVASTRQHADDGAMAEGVARRLCTLDTEERLPKSIEQSCGEAALVLLSSWNQQCLEDGSQGTLQEPGLQRHVCEALVQSLRGFFYSVELTEALTALLPRMPSFMDIWDFIVSDNEAQVEAFWSSPTLPSAETGEGLLLAALLSAMKELVGRVRESLPFLERHPRSGATAALVKWGCVLLSLLEGYPQLLLAPQGQACGELLLLLWEASPVTWLRVSGFWAQLKELRRDELVPIGLLRELSQRVAPACTASLLRHCRRSNPLWEGEGEDDWASFVEAGGDVFADLFCLALACGEAQAVAFVQDLIRPLAEATAAGDSSGAEAVLLLSDAVVEAFGFIPYCFAGAFVIIPSLPRDSRCASAAARLLRKTAIHFMEDPEYDGLQCGGAVGPPHCPVEVLGQIWLAALQAMTDFLPLQPQQVSDALLQLSIWGSHHLGAPPPDAKLQDELLGGKAFCTGETSSAREASFAREASPCPARRRQQLQEFSSFVARVAPQFSPQVDATLFAAVVKMMLHVERSEKLASFLRLLRRSASEIRACAAAEASWEGGRTETDLRTRLLFRVEGCVAALHSGRVQLSRSKDAMDADAEAASEALALFLLYPEEEQKRRLLQEGLRVEDEDEEKEQLAKEDFPENSPFASSNPLWISLLRLAEPTLIASAARAFSPSTNPIVSSTCSSASRAVDFSQLLSFKQRLQGQASELNGAVAVFACALRCLRLLLAVLNCRSDATDFWGAVVSLVEAVASASVQNASSPQTVPIAALQGCCVVVLSDILRIASVSPLLRRQVRDRVAEDVAASASLAVHISSQLSPELGGSSLPFFDVLSTFLAACNDETAVDAALPETGHSSKPFNKSNNNSAFSNSGKCNTINNAAPASHQPEGVSLFVSRVLPSALELSVHVLRGENSEAAKRCLSFLQQCSKRREAGLRLALNQSLPRLVVSILDGLPVWGAEALAVLWAVIAAWRETFPETLLPCVEAWLSCQYTSATEAGATPGVPAKLSPLQLLDPTQKQLLVLCLKSFRGPRIRQLLQDMILMASGLAVPGEALVAYEFLLRDSGAASPSGAGVIDAS